MLDYSDDVASDMRVLAHVDWRTLSGPEFFALAFRLPEYPGALRRRFLAEAKADKKRAEERASAAQAASTIVELEADGWIERE